MSAPPTDASPQADSEWALQAREQMAGADALLAQRFDRAEEIDRLTNGRAASIDGVVRDAWQRCMDPLALMSLFAVGGYGRGDLYPGSDIDLLVIAEDAAQSAQAESLARLFALLWDAGLPVGHAVRSLAQCTQSAADDITVMTALLEARPLVASDADVASLRSAIAPERVWPPQAYFEAKRAELEQRHARFGDTSDNLEPNLKEGPGGLRDIQTLRWMAMRLAGTRDLESLVALGQLGADEYDTLVRARREISRLRWGLHLVARKREERLRFDYQKALAERLGFIDTDASLAVEQLMQGFYRAAALISRINERLLQRFEETLEGDVEAVPLSARFELRHGYLAACEDAAGWPHANIAEVFALFATWAATLQARGLHSRTARALAESLPALPAFDTVDLDVRKAFIGLLRGPRPVETLKRLARLGVLGRWIPAFSQVTGRMQFDLFHVYTVDQHTLMVLHNMARFASGEADERFVIAHDVWPRLRKPELLLLAGLFHDIAKGRGGDHSQLGAVDARDFCIAHGLSESGTSLVAWLVEKHLPMSVTAQKQDIGDPAVIHRFATQVADRERLDLLYLLTCADIAGTSPKLWNAWKDRLLADLYTAARLALRRGLEHPVAAQERIAEHRAAAAALLEQAGVGPLEIEDLFDELPPDCFLRGRPDALCWQAQQLRTLIPDDLRIAVRPLGALAGALEIFVRSPDRDGLFAAIVATLDRLGLAIQQARLLDGPHGSVVDTFEVIPAEGQRIVLAAQVEQRLRDALATINLDDIHPARRTQPRHLRHFRIVPQVEFADTDAGRTLLSLVCTDRPGLLADVSRVLRTCGLRVHDARIATFGARAEDMFQISDEHDRALHDDHQRQQLRDALLDALDGESK
jgi:[protein-PII] uridylyltransferase